VKCVGGSPLVTRSVSEGPGVDPRASLGRWASGVPRSRVGLQCRMTGSSSFAEESNNDLVATVTGYSSIHASKRNRGDADGMAVGRRRSSKPVSTSGEEIDVRHVECGGDFGRRVLSGFPETLVRIRVRISSIGCDQPRGPSRSSVEACSSPRPGRAGVSRAQALSVWIVASPEDALLHFAPPVLRSTPVDSAIRVRLATVRDAVSLRTGERSLPTGFASTPVRLAMRRPLGRVSRAEAGCLRDVGCGPLRRLAVVDASLAGEVAGGSDTQMGCRIRRRNAHVLAAAV
jgi:hypothetical protein